MCDEDTERDAAEYLKSKLSRREFNTLAAGGVQHIQVGHRRCELPGACLIQVP